MNIRMMRWLDRWVGIPLCWLSGVLHKRRGHAQRPGAIRSILVMKFFGMGSVLLTTSFLETLRQAYPAARIHYLTFLSNMEILERLPVEIERHAVRTSSLVSFIRDTFAVLLLLRRARVDMVFDLEFFSKYSTLLSTLTGAAVRVGYALPTYWRKANITHPASIDRSAHVANAFLRQLEAIGMSAPTTCTTPVLHPTNAEEGSMRRKLGIGSNGAEWIAVNINAGATSLERRWPADRFLELVARLHDENGARRFFFTGSADERSYVQAALESRTNFAASAVNCAGLLSLGEFLALLRHCAVFITNDSGPMHVAASAGTPVVALFGPESPQFYGPLVHARVLYRQLACSPCLNVYNAKRFVCPYNARCMRELSVDEVQRAVQSLLRQQPVAHAC